MNTLATYHNTWCPLLSAPMISGEFLVLVNSTSLDIFHTVSVSISGLLGPCPRYREQRTRSFQSLILRLTVIMSLLLKCVILWEIFPKSKGRIMHTLGVSDPYGTVQMIYVPCYNGFLSLLLHSPTASPSASRPPLFSPPAFCYCSHYSTWLFTGDIRSSMARGTYRILLTVNLRWPEKRPTCSQLGSSKTLYPSVIQHTESCCLSNECSQLALYREKDSLTPRDNFNDPTANSNYKNSKLVTKLYVKSDLESHLSLVILF